MKFYDVDGYDRPLLLSPEHAELIGATERAQAEDPDAAPARNASADEWRDWALRSGAIPETVAGLSRAELIEQYGS